MTVQRSNEFEYDQPHEPAFTIGPPSLDLASGAVELPMSPTEDLQMLSRFRPSRDEHLLPHIPIRPLLQISDYACTTMPTCYEAVLQGTMSTDHLFGEVEELFATIDPDVIEQLMSTPTGLRARVASLDLAFLERFLSVAHGGPTQEYRARRAGSLWFRTAVRLAKSGGRSLFLGWSDIANGHPVWDPRTFLSPGQGQDQEILLYRIQSGIERAFRRIVVEWPNTDITTPKSCQIVADDLDEVVTAMIHVSRVREEGEFDKLNRFLAPNGEVHGHATGSFSVWTMLAGYVLTGHVLDRLIDPENRPVFDPEARPWIDAVVAGELTPLPRMQDADGNARDLTEYAIRQFGRFHEVHMGAMRRHAGGALDEQAPSDRLVTNRQSVQKFISITKSVVIGANPQDDNIEPEGSSTVA
jgi:hypothetical protein